MSDDGFAVRLGASDPLGRVSDAVEAAVSGPTGRGSSPVCAVRITVDTSLLSVGLPLTERVLSLLPSGSEVLVHWCAHEWPPEVYALLRQCRSQAFCENQRKRIKVAVSVCLACPVGAEELPLLVARLVAATACEGHLSAVHTLSAGLYSQKDLGVWSSYLQLESVAASRHNPSCGTEGDSGRMLALLTRTCAVEAKGEKQRLGRSTAPCTREEEEEEEEPGERDVDSLH